MNIEQITSYWRNTKSLPFLLRMIIQGAMVSAPVLLIFVLLPITEWEINGRRLSYTEFWSSGEGVALTIFLVLGIVGSWGFAARVAATRWLLVLLPIAPYIIFAIFFPKSAPITIGLIVNMILTAAAIYVCLFRLQAVRSYLGSENNDI